MIGSYRLKGAYVMNKPHLIVTFLINIFAQGFYQ